MATPSALATRCVTATRRSSSAPIMSFAAAPAATTTPASFAAALQLASHAQFHLLVTDLELLDGSGFPYRYLPSYSPDLNPIEPAWAQVKAELRRVAARDQDALQRALGPALDRVSAENARAYFRHCGYDRPD